MSRRHGLAAAAILVGLLAGGAAGPIPSPIRFRQGAAIAALRFRFENHPTPRKELIETVAGGVAAFDYNADGLTDIFFTNGATVPALEKESPKYWNRLYRNDGGWRFTDVTEEAGVQGAAYSMGVAAGDFDNDGNVDLFVAGVSRNLLYHNTGRGRFDDVTARAGIKPSVWSVAAGWFDYDGDGWLDLFVVNYVVWTPLFDRYCGDRARDLRVYCHPQYFPGLSNTLYRNRGDGTFEDVSERSGIARHVGKGMSVAFADYDRDGRPDAYVTNDTVPNFLFHNRGDGTFDEGALSAGVALPERGVPGSSMGADFRDYDNDGWPDLQVTALAGETFPLFRNLGRGQFEDAGLRSGLVRATSPLSGWSNALADLDNDGWKDIFTVNSHVNDEIEHFVATEYRQANAVFRNLGDGSFSDVSREAGADFQAAGAHRGAAFADFDRDGRIDVVTSLLGEPAELWVNESTAGHWLALKLVGTRSNRDGIGAVVRIGSQSNHMTTSVGYASSSHAPVHFGLGATKKVDVVEIVWPSGIIQRLSHLPVDRVLRVEEPASRRVGKAGSPRR